jgi:hypothetical protein
MVSQSAPTRTGTETETEAAQAIEELIADLGPQAVLGAVLGSTLAPSLERTGSGDAALRVTQVILREIVFNKDPQLKAEIMALGCGVILADDITMGKIGAKHGITRSAVSKSVVAWVKRHNLPPSIYMRSEKDRETYSMTNRPRQ